MTRYQKDVFIGAKEWGRVHVKIDAFFAIEELDRIIADVRDDHAGNIETFCRQLAHRLKCKVKFVPDNHAGYSYTHKYFPVVKIG